MKKLLGCFLCLTILFFGVSIVGATQVDLTAGKGDSDYVRDAYFKVFTDEMQESVSSGTGVIEPFLTIQNNWYEQGFNTDAKVPTTGMNQKRAGAPGEDGFTHSIQKSDLAYFTDPVGDGYAYYEFLLDINEENDNYTGADYYKDTSKLTMQALQIYVVDDYDASTITSLPLASYLEWDLDDYGNDISQVDLDFDIWQGSGQNMDLAVYIPESVFAGFDDDAWIILFSAFGSTASDNSGVVPYNYQSGDGFEEWAVRTGEQPVPEPATLFLLGTGLIGLASFGRKKVNN